MGKKKMYCNKRIHSVMPSTSITPYKCTKTINCFTKVKTQARAMTCHAQSKFDGEWIKSDPMVLVLGFLGWTVPSALPSSGFGGDSLFSRFINSIGNELAHFPSGPSIDSDFWIYLILYHTGLFLCILLGQIGVQGRKQGKFN